MAIDFMGDLWHSILTSGSCTFGDHKVTQPDDKNKRLEFIFVLVLIFAALVCHVYPSCEPNERLRCLDFET
jgi:hypothetical protein